jgi:hypothetical protein
MTDRGSGNVQKKAADSQLDDSSSSASSFSLKSTSSTMSESGSSPVSHQTGSTSTRTGFSSERDYKRDSFIILLSYIKN